jgi:hypothetical protein
MRIRVVSSKKEIEELGQDEEMVHLAFRPSNTDILSLIMKCPQIKALHIPNSYKRSISDSSKMYLKMRDIELLEGDVWGHRKDINEYSEISPSVYERIKECQRIGMNEENIIEKLARETRLGTDLISFIVKDS